MARDPVALSSIPVTRTARGVRVRQLRRTYEDFVLVCGCETDVHSHPQCWGSTLFVPGGWFGVGIGPSHIVGRPEGSRGGQCCPRRHPAYFANTLVRAQKPREPFSAGTQSYTFQGLGRPPA